MSYRWEPKLAKVTNLKQKCFESLIKCDDKTNTLEIVLKSEIVGNSKYLRVMSVEQLSEALLTQVSNSPKTNGKEERLATLHNSHSVQTIV